jgi:hypothetical protein
MTNMQTHIQFNITEHAHITKHIIILIALACIHALVELQAHHTEHTCPSFSKQSRIIYKNLDDEHIYKSLQPTAMSINKCFGDFLFEMSQPSLQKTKELHTSK